MFDNHLLFSFQKNVKEDICVLNLLSPSRQKTKKLIKEDAMRASDKSAALFLFLFEKKSKAQFIRSRKLRQFFLPTSTSFLEDSSPSRAFLSCGMDSACSNL